MSAANSEHKCYVGGLALSTTKNVLRDAFSSCGAIRGCWINRGGSGYISFATETGMKRAIREMNGTILDGSVIVVHQALKAGESTGWYECFVSGLASNTNEDTLWSAFSKFGEVLGAKVNTYRKNGFTHSKGSGLVNFATEDAMDAAIEGMNGKNLDGRFIAVNRAQYTCCVRGFPQKSNEATLNRVFNKFGEILSIEIVRSTDDTGKLYSEGYGYVTFSRKENMIAAIKEKNGKKIDQCVVEVTEARD